MNERCIHRDVCRYINIDHECRDGVVVTHLATGDIAEHCERYMPARTCRNVSPSKDEAVFECSHCGETWHAMRYEMGDWMHENPVFCPSCGSRVAG